MIRRTQHERIEALMVAALAALVVAAIVTLALAYSV